MIYPLFFAPLILCLVGTHFVTNACQEHVIEKVSTFNKLSDYLTLHSQITPSAALVTVDLDHTAFKPKNREQAGGELWFRNHFLATKDLEKTLPLYRKLQQFLQVEPADHSVIPTIASMQKAGFPLFALTARGPEIAAHTARMLKEMGLSFKETQIPHLEACINSLENPYLYAQEGVVHAPKGKGDALVSIFNACNLNPAQLIHIDDSQKHLDDISSKLATTYPNTHFTGLLYTGCEHLEQTYDHESTQPVIKAWHGKYLPHVNR